MAKKKMNRSQIIRDYAQANPNDKPKAIAEALKGKGIKVSAQYVSTILSTSKKKSGKKQRKRGGADGVGMRDLMLAKNLIVETGGVEKAQEAIASYAKLMA